MYEFFFSIRSIPFHMINKKLENHKFCSLKCFGKTINKTRFQANCIYNLSITNPFHLANFVIFWNKFHLCKDGRDILGKYQVLLSHLSSEANSHNVTKPKNSFFKSYKWSSKLLLKSKHLITWISLIIISLRIFGKNDCPTIIYLLKAIFGHKVIFVI